MFRITSNNYQGYDLVASIAVKYDGWKDSFTGEELKDEVVVYTPYNPRRRLVSELRDTVYFSMESLDEIIRRLDENRKSKISNKEGETLFDIEKLEEDAPNFKQNIKGMREKLREIEYNQVPVEDAFMFDSDTSDEMIPTLPIPKNKSFGNLIVFGKIPVIESEIDSDFDFMDYLKDYKNSGSFKCDYCRSRRRRKRGYITERKSQVCSRCAKNIRKKCAKLGDNQELINEIVADTI